MKRSLRCVVPLLLLLCLLGGIGVRVGNALWENARLEQGFTPKEGIPPYDETDPLKSWDYTGLIQELAEEYRELPMEYQTLEWYASSMEIPWYTEPSTSSDITFVAESGRLYCARSPIVNEYSAEIVLMEGRNSWPTHKKGWRYSIPFWKPEKGASGTRPKALPAYVRLGDLEAVEYTMMEEQGIEYVPYRERVLDLIRGGELPDEVREGVTSNYIPPIYIDKLLYENGIYISPDLYLDVWDGWDTLMAAGAVLLVVFTIVIEVRIKKQRRASAREKGKE